MSRLHPCPCTITTPKHNCNTQPNCLTQTWWPPWHLLVLHCTIALIITTAATTTMTPWITATTNHLVPVWPSTIARTPPCATVKMANYTHVPIKKVAAGCWDIGFFWYCWLLSPSTTWPWCTFLVCFWTLYSVVHLYAIDHHPVLRRSYMGGWWQ